MSSLTTRIGRREGSAQGTSELQTDIPPERRAIGEWMMDGWVNGWEGGRVGGVDQWASGSESGWVRCVSSRVGA